MIIDARAMIAVLDSLDPFHEACMGVLTAREEPLRTTEAVITEAMHIASKKFRRKGCRKLWDMWDQGVLAVHALDLELAPRARSLMEKYRDLPMDFGDATLVVLAERLDDDEVFTLDSDFRVYRINGRKRFRVVP